MSASERILTAIAGALLALSVFTMFVSPAVGAPCAAAALAIAIFLKRRDAFREGNLPLLGVLLIGGSGIMSIGGLLGVTFLVSMKAASILFLLMLAPGFGLLILFADREGWRRFRRWIGQQPDEPPP